MKINCWNKILKQNLPAEKVFSADTLHWLESVIKHSKEKQFEDEFCLYTADMIPDQFGEFFRTYFFTKGKGFGCYENFEVESFMVQSPLPADVEAKYFKNWDSRVYFFHCKGQPSIWLAWSWDGDGLLIVSDGQKVCINNDCKKSYGWEFIN